MRFWTMSTALELGGSGDCCGETKNTVALDAQSKIRDVIQKVLKGFLLCLFLKRIEKDSPIYQGRDSPIVKHYS
jgi:hypothetical protein